MFCSHKKVQNLDLKPIKLTVQQSKICFKKKILTKKKLTFTQKTKTNFKIKTKSFENLALFLFFQQSSAKI